MNDDDDKPEPENNFRVIREVEINNVLTQQHDYRYVQADSVLFHTGFVFTGLEGDYMKIRSDSWVVCTWSSISILEIVIKNLGLWNGQLRFFTRVGENEYYQIEIPRKRNCEWIVNNIFITEQVVYAYPRSSYVYEFSESLQMIRNIQSIKININNSLRNHDNYQQCTSTLQQEEPIIPSPPKETYLEPEYEVAPRQQPAPPVPPVPIGELSAEPSVELGSAGFSTPTQPDLS